VKPVPWTSEEDAHLLKHGVKSLLCFGKRTQRACDTRLYTLRTRAKTNPGRLGSVPGTFEQDRAARGADYWERQHKELSKKYGEALKSLAVVDRLVDAAKDMAPQSYQALPPAIPPTVRHADGSPQSAVLHLSDPHVGLVVSPKQTLGFGGYNFSIFLDRLSYLEDSIRSIITNHTTTPIEELVIAWGGDIVNGSLEHSAEAGQESTVFAQVYGAAHAFAQFLRNVSPLFPHVRNFCVAGNHGRWANQKKMPTQNRYSNLDSFVYALVSALTRDLVTIEWVLDEQPVADFEVQGHRFLSMHGDVWKGGDKALGLPAHAIGRQLATSAALYAKAGMVPPAYILSGHLHRQFEIPTASGAVLINGGWPGLDTYGMAAAFTPVDPSQRFFFVHPRFKITAAYSLSLGHATLGHGSCYDIPGNITLE
jgi:hypothetical protein